MTVAAKDCRQCFQDGATLRDIRLFRLTARQCVECGLIVDVGIGSGQSGQLLGFESSQASATVAMSTEPSPQLYVIQGRTDVESLLAQQLVLSEGAECCFHQSASEAITQITTSLRSGLPVRLILINPEVMGNRASSALYAVRALEMSLGVSSIPILVLGESATPSMERAIKECKNAKFVSIGRSTDASVLAERYLKVIQKLAGG